MLITFALADSRCVLIKARASATAENTAGGKPGEAQSGRDGCTVEGATGSGVRFATALAYEARAAVGLPFEPDAATTAHEPPLCHRADKSAASLTESVQPC
ncbi:hypothetical protein ACU7M0_36575, partial [Burkholderia cenocepacia]